MNNAADCMFCGDCEKLNTSYADKVVTISQVPDVFEFVVEGTGSVRPLEILKQSIHVLNVRIGRMSMMYRRKWKRYVNV